MKRYLTFRETDEGGRLCYYILQKAFPHYVGIISLGRIEGSLASSPIAGYNMYVNFTGTLRGNFIPSYADVLDEITAVFNDMAIWFLENRILNDQKKYAKYKI